MGKTALSALTQQLSETIGDWISEAVTTNVAANKLIVSTHLNKWDDGNDDAFRNHWVYITDKNNAGEDRKVRFYYTANATANCFGADFSADTAPATVRVHRYSYTVQKRAINDAIRDCKGVLFNKIDNQDLITGSWLPDTFQWWNSATVLKHFNTSNANIAQTNTGNLKWVGDYSVKVMATAANGNCSVNSVVYPRLLDLSGCEVDFRAMARPTEANGAVLELHAVNATGSSQTLRSTTVSVANNFKLITMSEQELLGDMTYLEARFVVPTSAKDAYFSNPRLLGKDTLEYLLPKPLQAGEVRQVFIQTSGDSVNACDDIHPRNWGELINWDVIEDNGEKYLTTGYFYSDERRLRIIGTTPLEECTNYSDTIDLDGDSLNLLIARAAYRLFKNEKGVPSSKDKGTYASRADDYLTEYYRLLPKFRMSKPATRMIVPASD